MRLEGCGIDIIEVDRFTQAMKRWGDDFLKRILTPYEIEKAKERRFDPFHLAGRFAAKEAVLKALNREGLGFKDIEILNDGDGCPKVTITCNDRKLKDLGVLISISHSRDYAVASSITFKKA